LFPGQPDKNEVVHVAHIMPDAEPALYEVIKRIEIDKRIELAEKIADWNSDLCVMFNKQHHDVDQSRVFDLALNLFAQDPAIDSIKEFSDIE